MLRVPKYRDETKGNLRAIKAECVQFMRSEINSADHFIIEWADCADAVCEYASLLTDAELAQCFKTARA